MIFWLFVIATFFIATLFVVAVALVLSRSLSDSLALLAAACFWLVLGTAVAWANYLVEASDVARLIYTIGWAIFVVIPSLVGPVLAYIILIKRGHERF